MDDDNIVWGTYDDQDNIIWGTWDGDDNIIWGTTRSGSVVGGTSYDDDNIVWGTSDDDNIVWGTERTRQHHLGHVDRNAGGTVMATASRFEMFPSLSTPSAGPSRLPSSRDWRIGLPVLQGAAVALRELRASRCAGAADRFRLAGSHAADFAASADARAGSRSSSRGRSGSAKPDSRSRSGSR